MRIRVRVLSSAIAFAMLTAVAPARADLPPAASGEDAYRHVLTYAGMGLHRTGTAGDLPTHEWIRDEFVALGMQASIEPFTFPRFEPTDVSVVVDDLDVDAFPIYYSGRTGPAGVTGPLVTVGAGTPVEMAGKDLSGAVVLIEAPWALSFTAPTLAGALTAAADGGAVAAIVAIQGAGNEIVAQNVDARAGLCAFPAVVIGKQDGAALRARAGAPATLTLTAGYHDGLDGRDIGETYNTVGVLPGTSDDVILIGTPVNGWFTGAAERGPGVGTLLTLARHYAEGDAPEHTLVFVATGGHEVGFLGLERFLAEHADLLPRIVSYVHFGATLAAKEYEEVGDVVVETGTAEENRGLFISENPILEALGEASMKANAALPMASIPPRALNPGEQRYAYALGVPIVSISGAHLYFHTSRDLVDTTSAELLDPVVRAFRDIVDGLLLLDAATVGAANAVAAAIAPAAAAGSC